MKVCPPFPQLPKFQRIFSKTFSKSNTLSKFSAQQFQRQQIHSPPAPPKPEDCCHNSCAQCVWKLYFEELKQYRAACKTEAVQAANTPMDVFERLEQKLQKQAELRAKKQTVQV
eukprot:TRINITY_DN490_c0_g1_i2.p3 TRINITY_DN490_c0_g1~~TRINITY_DN490_c0_g1_i2.p3  ORF type:complete len:114 (+),score=5.67 TRINITY_DN490_c0_g1_i2:248-589(+)